MMNATSRALLILGLLCGFSPAIAQAPPPVPALPDTARVTTYSVSASLCTCAVGFALYGDSTDYANWLQVYVNGAQIQQANNWTITSPSGSLSTMARPVTDAVLTFSVAQTGTVQIVGARRPRRTSQFQESQPVPTRNFNVVLSDLTAQNRETWDRQATFLRGAPGAVFGAVPANCPNAGLGFDVTGTNFICTAGGLTGISNYIAAVVAATPLAVLPNTPVYANGASGVGATLTAGSNGALAIDGVTLVAGNRVLIKDQVSTFQNGVYVVNQVGSVSTPYILMRVTDFDQPSEMIAATGVVVTGGNINGGSGWLLASTVSTVGTSPAVFNLFSAPTAAAATTVLTVKSFGAKGDGVTNDQVAFQAALDASCPGHLSGLVNQVFPIIIPASANPYLVTELNATNCNGFTMWGQGSGAIGPVVKYTSATNAILDMTGSGAGFNLKNFALLGPISDGISATYPNYGLLIAVTNAGGGNFGEIDNVNVGGRFQQAAMYVYGVCCSLATMTSINNYNQNNPNSYGLVLTATNVLSAVSDFVTIGTGVKGGGDWTFNRGEAHAFTSGATTSAQAVFLDGVPAVNWIGGQIAACNTFLMRTNGNVANASFIGTTFYCDSGTTPTVLFGAGSGNMTNLILENTYVKLANAGTIFSGQALTSGTVINGTLQIGIVVSQFHSGGIGTAPTASPCGSGGAVVGTDQSGQVTVAGTTTGCTITFTTPFSSVHPMCIVSTLAGNTGLQYSVSGTVLTMTWSSAAGVIATWKCNDAL